MRRAPITPANRGQAGFTLLELLISMTLLGLLMVVLFGGFRFGARAWERNTAQATATDEVRLAQALLRRELSRIYPMFRMDQANLEARHVDFDGNEERMTFLAPAPDALGEPGRARITLWQASENGQTALVMSARGELAANATPASAVLIRGLEEVNFSYYGSESPQEQARWVGRWTNRKWLPQLIRVDARFAAGDARSWPQLIVAPRISADVSCVYDPLTKFCLGRRW